MSVYKNGETVRDKYGNYGDNWKVVAANVREWNLSSSDVDRLINKSPDTDNAWYSDVKWVHAIRMLNDKEYADQHIENYEKAKIAEFNKDIDLKIAYKSIQIDLIREKISKND